MSPQEQHPHAVLFPERAFVVQFTTDTQVGVGYVMGRVEHVVSRQATRFQSLEALLSFIAQVLREVGDASFTPPP